VKRNYGLATKTPSSSYPTASTSNSKTAWAARGNEERTKWTALFADYSKKFPELAARLAKCSAVHFPTAGTKIFRTSLPTRKVWPPAKAPAKFSTLLAQNIPWLVRRLQPTSPSPTRTNLVFEGAGDFFTTNTRAATSTSAFANTAWAPPSTAFTLTGLRGFSATFFNFSDYMRASMPPRPLSWKFPLSSSSRTIPSASAKMALPTSPLSNSPAFRAMPNMLGLSPRRRQRSHRAYKVAMQHTHGLPRSSSAARPYHVRPANLNTLLLPA